MNPLVFKHRVFENPAPMPSPLAPIPKKKRLVKRCACRTNKRPVHKKGPNPFYRAFATVMCLLIIIVTIRLSMMN